MNNLFCSITGRRVLSMRFKILLRVLFLAILVFVKTWFGMDWVLIIAAVVIVADLDEIADAIIEGGKKNCK